MVSRRIFLLAAAGLITSPYAALAKKKKAEVRPLAPHALSMEQWPPAIQPDFIDVVDRGLALLGDQSGRLAIVDLKREQGPLVEGELFGIGKKVVDMSTFVHRAYAIVYRENQAGEPQYMLTTISLAPTSEPSIMWQQPLSYFTEPNTVAASSDLVAVGGVGLNGENQVLLFSSNRRRPDETAQPIATIGLDQPVSKLSLQDKQLVILQAGTTTQLQVYSLINVRSPQRVGVLKLNGNYAALSRSHDLLTLAGQGTNHLFNLQIVSLKQSPRVVSTAPLPLSEVLDVSLGKDQVLVLGNQSGRQAVIPVQIRDKGASLNVQNAVVLPSGSHGAASKARIVAKERDAYIVSDWGGVLVLNVTKSGWEYKFSYTIPRLPAAAISVQGDFAVLGGTDLKTYNISDPAHPTLLHTTETGSAVRAVRIIDGNLMLVLSHDRLTLRRLEKPGEVVASAKVSGRSLAYDRLSKRVYVLAPQSKSTIVSTFKVDDGLAPEKILSLPAPFEDAAADNGRLLVSGLNSVMLFELNETAQQLASRTFPNFAIRDTSLSGDIAVVTAVDSSSRGHILVLNVQKEDLPTVGTVDVPQDAVALAVEGNSAIVIGREPSGKDVASIIDLANHAAPKVISSFPVLEAAAAVAIKGKLALIAGRGLEILSLS